MKQIAHVNQHVIKSNHKTGERKPVLTVKTYKSNDYAHEVVIYDKQGNEVARVVYRPDNPLPCGAKVWLEVLGEIDLINRPASPGSSPSRNAASKTRTCTSPEQPGTCAATPGGCGKPRPAAKAQSSKTKGRRTSQ